MVGHIKKSNSRLAWPMVLWTRTAQVSSIVDTYVEGQRSSSCWWSLSYCMAVIHGHWTPTWRDELMSLVISAFVESWGIAGMPLCQISDHSVRLIQGLLPVHFHVHSSLVYPWSLSPIELTSTICSLSMNLMLYASKKPSGSTTTHTNPLLPFHPFSSFYCCCFYSYPS